MRSKVQSTLFAAGKDNFFSVSLVASFFLFAIKPVNIRFNWLTSGHIVWDPDAFRFGFRTASQRNLSTISTSHFHMCNRPLTQFNYSMLVGPGMDDDYDFIIILHQRQIPTFALFKSRNHHRRMVYVSIFAFLYISLTLSLSLSRSFILSSLWDIPLILMTIKPFSPLADALISSFRPLTYFVFGGSNPYADAIIKYGCALSALDGLMRVCVCAYLSVFVFGWVSACYLFKIEYFPHLSLMMSKNCTFFLRIFLFRLRARSPLSCIICFDISH